MQACLGRYNLPVEDYTLQALGHVIRQHREEQGLTQEELGRAADYSDASAGVSISRLEGGGLKPKSDKLIAIASKLGVPWEALQAEAVARSGGADRDERRIERIRRASVQREELDGARCALLEARERATTGFLVPLRRVATRLTGTGPHQSGIREVAGEPGDDVGAEATYQINFTRYGLEHALAEGDERADFGHFAETVALGVAAAAALETAIPSPTARRGLLAAMGLAARPRLVPGGGMLAAVAVGVAVAAVVDRQQSKQARRRRETAARLDAAEEDLARTQANVDALDDIIARATELFEYVALHAAHAVVRWCEELGDGPIDWTAIDSEQRQRYDDFVEIAAAQLAVATIDLQEIAASRGSDLDRAVALADQILLQSREAITSRV